MELNDQHNDGQGDRRPEPPVGIVHGPQPVPIDVLEQFMDPITEGGEAGSSDSIIIPKEQPKKARSNITVSSIKPRPLSDYEGKDRVDQKSEPAEEKDKEGQVPQQGQ